jgi:polar amino acid transport system substrate-binding protein
MNKKLKIIIQVWTILAFLLLSVIHALSKEKKIFSIGWDPWMPYQHINENGRLVGLDVEMLQTIFSEMGCKLEYKEVPWKQLLPAVKRGQIALAAGASKSADRMKYAYFSNPYRTESVVLFVRKGEQKAIKHLSDIIGTNLKIGILKGNYYGQNFELLMKNKNFKAHIQTVTQDVINIKKTLNKRIDGFLSDQFAGISAINKEGAFNRFDIHPVPITSSDIHVMFSKKNCLPYDVKHFNDVLKKLKKNGHLKQIIHRYFQ